MWVTFDHHHLRSSPEIITLNHHPQSSSSWEVFLMKTMKMRYTFWSTLFTLLGARRGHSF
jgi:hypothetical protein